MADGALLGGCIRFPGTTSSWSSLLSSSVTVQGHLCVGVSVPGSDSFWKGILQAIAEAMRSPLPLSPSKGLCHQVAGGVQVWPARSGQRSVSWFGVFLGLCVLLDWGGGVTSSLWGFLAPSGDAFGCHECRGCGGTPLAPGG